MNYYIGAIDHKRKISTYTNLRYREIFLLFNSDITFFSAFVSLGFLCEPIDIFLHRFQHNNVNISHNLKDFSLTLLHDNTEYIIFTSGKKPIELSEEQLKFGIGNCDSCMAVTHHLITRHFKN